MLDNIEINNFRSIENLKIENFKNMNFFFGRANSAKTSVLEAIYLYLGRGSKNIADIMQYRRNIIDNDCIDGLFYNYNIDKEASIFISSNLEYKIEIKKSAESIVFSNDDNNSRSDVKELKYIIQDNKTGSLIEIPFSMRRKFSIREIEIEAQANNPKNTVYLGYFSNEKIISKNVSKIINNGQLDDLNEYCKKFDNNISQIMMSENNSIKVLEKDKKPVNLKLMGQGFQAYLRYVSSILLKNEFICIDEIENGLHFEHIDLILKILLKLSIQHNIQFFITTHSKELLERLAKIADENADFKNKIACFNLYKEDNKIKYIKYNSESFSWNMENGNELRS
ncbi:AAA family ATPase [Campylobacter sp.]|uniref:AAA family ATPase n=1 Tax=Campylobacter sp. TaxID=205 RepID=UPI002A757D81|nr:AAA family ATPase [Campylobacter sp.]MDY3246439.1 AAA family ATPase [Campylobacter sp.]